MAGRGRGRGKSIQLSGDQVVGFNKTEVLPPILQPPPDYPVLEHKALPLNMSTETSYLLNLKKDFTEFMRESHYFIQPVEVKKDIERYSDRYQDLMTTKESYEKIYNWNRLPVELKPSSKRRKKSKNTKEAKRKKVKEVDVDAKLKELEKKENTGQSEGEEEEKEEDDEDKDVDENKGEEEEEEVDEEMDEGTDYVNNYFDNGENYEDDEDNLDDGAIF